MTDLHCHILHDIDDGPGSLNESLELCRIASCNQIERIVTTPHVAEFSMIENFLRKREERLGELRRALIQLDMKLELYPGAEVLINDEIFRTDRLSLLAINHSRYLLVEFPHTGLSTNKLKNYIAEIENRRLIPILAHPERYTYFQHDYEILNILLQNGALAQVNASSLCMPGNRAEHRLAGELVRQRAASFLATDAHSVQFRPNNLLEMLSRLALNIDFDYLDAMVNINPNHVLQDKVLDTGERRNIKKGPHG